MQRVDFFADDIEGPAVHDTVFFRQYADHVPCKVHNRPPARQARGHKSRFLRLHAVLERHSLKRDVKISKFQVASMGTTPSAALFHIGEKLLIRSCASRVGASSLESTVAHEAHA